MQRSEPWQHWLLPLPEGQKLLLGQQLELPIVVPLQVVPLAQHSLVPFVHRVVSEEQQRPG
jgi:hypothetical protein